MTPDFKQIAQQLAEDGSESGIVDSEHIEDIAEQFRLIWNARGAADITLVEAGLLTMIDVADRAARQHILVLKRELRTLDR